MLGLSVCLPVRLHTIIVSSSYYYHIIAAGVTATCIAHPLDTLKTRIMTGTKSRMPLIPTLKGILKNEGFLVLFRGLPANVYQAGLTSMGFSVSYEAIKKFSLGVVGPS